MASGPITSWQIDGETMETMRDFISLGPKITADGDCSHQIKRCLLLGRKVMTNLDRILKSRDITLLTKVHLVKAMVFPVVMYECERMWELDYKESWALKNWCFCFCLFVCLFHFHLVICIFFFFFFGEGGGGGIGMGNTCKPMAVSFQCMTKFTTNKKKLKK